jgi:hypothetical protein
MSELMKIFPYLKLMKVMIYSLRKTNRNRPNQKKAGKFS